MKRTSSLEYWMNKSRGKEVTKSVKLNHNYVINIVSAG